MASIWQILSGVASGGITSIADAIMNANGIHNHEEGSQALKDSLENAGNTDFAGGPTNALFGENGVLSNPAGAWDNFKNGSTNATNQAIAKENLEYQRERNEIEDARYEEETAYNRAFAENERDYQRAFAAEQQSYDRALQQLIFEREDTALERQASALSAMGINPLSQQLNGLGAGQAISASTAGASAGAPSLSSRGGIPLHNDFSMQDSGLVSILGPLMEVANSIDNLNTNGLQRDSIRENINHQKLVNESQAVENEYQRLLLEEKIKASQAGTENTKANTESTKSATKRAEDLHPSQLLNSTATAERNQRENKFQEDWGVTDNSSKYARLGADAAAAIATQTEKQKDLSDKSPLSITSKKLKQSASIVGNAFANTFGKGAKKIIDFINRNNGKTKYHYYDSNGKKHSYYDYEDNYVY